MIAHPRFMSISFSNDVSTMVSVADDFVATVGSTSYWAAATSEYGVGAATAAPAVHLAETATGTLDDSNIQSWLNTKLTSASAPLGQPDSSTLYVIFYPANVTITLQGLTSCSGFGGYHEDMTVGSTPVMYAVMPRCAGFVPGASDADGLTGATSHEMIEAVTDPFPTNNPAYASVDGNHDIWNMILYGEAGDLCVWDPQAFFTPPGYSHMVQRTWSNQATGVGADPCVPALPSENYFSAVPVMNDTVNYYWQAYSYSGQTQGVKIPVGQSKTIDVDVFSQSATGPITVWGGAYPSSSTLTFSPGQATGVNGDVLHFTVNHVSDDPAYGSAPFVIGVQLGNTTHYYFGLVGD